MKKVNIQNERFGMLVAIEATDKLYGVPYPSQAGIFRAYGKFQDKEAFQGQEKPLCIPRPVADIRGHP